MSPKKKKRVSSPSEVVSTSVEQPAPKTEPTRRVAPEAKKPEMTSDVLQAEEPAAPEPVVSESKPKEMPQAVPERDPESEMLASRHTTLQATLKQAVEQMRRDVAAIGDGSGNGDSAFEQVVMQNAMYPAFEQALAHMPDLPPPLPPPLATALEILRDRSQAERCWQIAEHYNRGNAYEPAYGMAGIYVHFSPPRVPVGHVVTAAMQVHTGRERLKEGWLKVRVHGPLVIERGQQQVRRSGVRVRDGVATVRLRVIDQGVGDVEVVDAESGQHVLVSFRPSEAES